MDDDRTERLIRKIEANRLEIERVKSTGFAHEQVCAERYRRIEDRQNAISGDVAAGRLDIAAILTKVEALAQKEVAAAAAIDKRFLAIAVGAIMLLVSALAWTGGQLYAMEPTRAADAKK